MTSVRLPKDIEKKLEKLSRELNVTKSHLISEALNEYLTRCESPVSPYESGKDLFGRYGSGDGTLSATYKRRVRDRIRENHHSR
ncbi:MAG: CopG family transcriptional regulator [Spirochaetaceae bacterium]|nr:MAG: CopG family transcriptional regulator [Spirochaetaceae bacterium]